MNGWWFINGPNENNEMPTVKFLGSDLRDGDVLGSWVCMGLLHSLKPHG